MVSDEKTTFVGQREPPAAAAGAAISRGGGGLGGLGGLGDTILGAPLSELNLNQTAATTAVGLSEQQQQLLRTSTTNHHDTHTQPITNSHQYQQNQNGYPIHQAHYHHQQQQHHHHHHHHQQQQQQHHNSNYQNQDYHNDSKQDTMSNSMLQYVNLSQVRNMIAQHLPELVLVCVIIIYLVYYFSRVSKRPKLIGNSRSKFVGFIKANLGGTLSKRFSPLIYFWGTNPQTCLFGYLQGNLSIDEVPRNKFKRQYLYVNDVQYLTTNVDLSQHYSKNFNKAKTKQHQQQQAYKSTASQPLQSTNNENNLHTLNPLALPTISLLDQNIRFALSSMLSQDLKQLGGDNNGCERLENREQYSDTATGCSDHSRNHHHHHHHHHNIHHRQQSRHKSLPNHDEIINQPIERQQQQQQLQKQQRRQQQQQQQQQDKRMSDFNSSSSSGSSSDSGVYASRSHSTASSASSSSSGSSLTIDMPPPLPTSSSSSNGTTKKMLKKTISVCNIGPRCNCSVMYEADVHQYLEPIYVAAGSDETAAAIEQQKLQLINQQQQPQQQQQQKQQQQQHPPPPPPTMRTEQLEFGQCALDWYKDSHKNYHNNKLVALISGGMTTGSDKKYVTDTVQTLDQLGYEVCVFIRRGVGGLKLSSTRFFSPSKWRDFEAAILSIRKQRPGANLVAIGFSFGSIELCRYLVMSGTKSLVDAALLVSCPFDPEAGGRNMRKRALNRKIDAYLAKNLGQQLHQALLLSNNNININNNDDDTTVNNESTNNNDDDNNNNNKGVSIPIESQRYEFCNLNGSIVDLTALSKIKSLVDFEDNYNRVLQNYPNSDAYAADSRLSEHLFNIKTPTLCLSSEDDFMAPIRLLPIEQIKANENLCMILTKRGGHMAFIDGLVWPKKPYFAQRIISDYMSAIRESFLPGGPRFKSWEPQRPLNHHQLPYQFLWQQQPLSQHPWSHQKVPESVS